MNAEKATNEYSKIWKVSIPSLDITPLGATNYAGWTASLKLFLRMIPVNKKRVWHRSINNYPFDDRITTIDAHITEYERHWNSFPLSLAEHRLKMMTTLEKD
jgi:hypothetical protein